MPFGLNWVDLVILGTLIFFALEAIGRPLILELLDLASFFLAALVSFSLYNIPAKFFEKEFSVAHGLSLVLGFMIAWFGAELIFYLLVRIIIPKIQKINIPWSKTFSVIPALIKGLILVAIALVMVATFPVQPVIKKAVLDSNLGSRILKRAYVLDQPIKQIFGGVANDSLTFLTIQPKTNEKVNLGFQTSEFTQDTISEDQMVDLVNKERASRELRTLVLDERLRAVARGHSADMFKRGYFSHYSPDPDLIGAEGLTVADRCLNAGIDFLVAGENLAFAPSVELAHKGLMNSEGHRANILSTDYGKIGIGVMDGGVYGKMFTQVFTN